MDILYLLIPFSALAVLALIATFGWALFGGQFDDLEREGTRILSDDAPALDAHQQAKPLRAEESPRAP
jgi:cbb3-type cytochrome oxidase maturation protein